MDVREKLVKQLREVANSTPPIGGYHFDDPKWVEQYLGDLESGEIEISVRNREEIYSLDMEDGHGSTDV